VIAWPASFATVGSENDKTAISTNGTVSGTRARPDAERQVGRRRAILSGRVVAAPPSAALVIGEDTVVTGSLDLVEFFRSNEHHFGVCC
jgi:hypothetical protein